MDWLREHSTLLTWLFGLSLASLALTAALLPILVVRLPVGYFRSDVMRVPLRRRSVGGLLWHLLKNLLGIVFVVAGIAMLVLPGQGLLTIVIGLLLIDVPGKRRLELWLVRKRRVLAMMNRLRKRFDQPPFVFDDPVETPD